MLAGVGIGAVGTDERAHVFYGAAHEGGLIVTTTVGEPPFLPIFMMDQPSTQ